jgi:hypothetical protein
MNIRNWLSGLRPGMIEVHHYKVLDPATGSWTIAPLKCTAESIAKLNGQIVNGTMDVVARTSLDKDGCFDPKTAYKKAT